MELTADICERLSLLPMQASHLNNVCICQLVEWAFLATPPGDARVIERSAFNLVSRVISLAPPVEMVRSAARRIMAPVKRTLSVIRRSNVKGKGNSRRLNILPFVVEKAVAIAITFPSPQPAPWAICHNEGTFHEFSLDSVHG